MDKKVFFTLTTTLFIGVLLLTGLTCIEKVEANPITYQPPKVTFLTPLNTTYSYFDVPLVVTIQFFSYTYDSIETLDWLNYSLDGKTFTPMTLTPMPSSYGPGYFRVGSAVITDLPDGIHTVFIQGQTTFGNIKENIQANVTFTTNTHITPTPTVPEFPSQTLLILIALIAIALISIVMKKTSNIPKALNV